MQPNKVYIGGLPEHTRKEDLESCFGKIGNIINIELKYVPSPCHKVEIVLIVHTRVGYGFVVRYFHTVADMSTYVDALSGI